MFGFGAKTLRFALNKKSRTDALYHFLIKKQKKGELSLENSSNNSPHNSKDTYKILVICQ